LQTPNESDGDLTLEIAHVLLIDVVGYSKLLVNEQIEVLQMLNRVVREAPHFRSAEAAGKLMRLPTGDGMALLFFEDPEAPVHCALEISATAKQHPQLQLRLGIHSGPIKEVRDVNDRANFAGAGINLAQRVLDSGDAGHILLSSRVAEDLTSYRKWNPYLTDLGECEVKHGLKMRLFNLCKDGLGNPALPQRLKAQQEEKVARSKSLEATARAGLRIRKVAAWLAAVAVIVAIAVSIWWVYRPAPTGRSIAVLPFADVAEGGGNAVFVNGMQEDLLTYLSRIRGLKVISRTSAMQYPAGPSRNLRDIARALDVTHVLEGTVLRIGNRVRVHAQLIEAATDAHVWADRYDGDLQDVFDIQSEIATKITAQLRLRLSPEEKAAIEEAPTENVAAHGLYVQAKDLIDGSVISATGEDDLLRAVDLLTKAIGLDPQFYLAVYQLAHAHDQLYLRYDSTQARLSLAEAALRGLEQLRPNSGEVHLGWARHLYWGFADYERARRRLAVAEQLLPNDPTVPLLTGYLDRRQGRWEESNRHLKRSIELDPNNRYTLQQLALTYSLQRRFREAAEVLDRVVEISGNEILARTYRAAVDVEWRADTARLRAVVQAALAAGDAAASKIVDHRIYLALLERDSVGALAALAETQDEGCATATLPFPNSWCEGLAARLRNDGVAAEAAFTRMRREIAPRLEQSPTDAGAACVLALSEAALGNKGAAIREGERAVALMPSSKDAVTAPMLLGYLAVIYAWTGENALAVERLDAATIVPSYWSYGNLKLHPQWDPLRGDPRFETIVHRLAPKE
jgi:TolB-like protein/Tfp pilus assembly protein PilF